MLSRWVRTWHTRLLAPFVLALARLGVTPNGLTLASWFVITIAGLALAVGNFILGGGVLLIGAIMDGIDGELARVTGAETSAGAFLDSIADHYGDFALYLGLFWFYLEQSARVELLLILLALFGSLVGSLIRSRAGMVGINTKDVGFATRLERMLVLLVGLFANRMLVALAILTLINNLSAVERLFHTLRAIRRARGGQ